MTLYLKVDSTGYSFGADIYAYFHCVRRDELRNLTEVATNAEKDAFRGFKVIQGHRVWHQSKGRMRLPASG